MGSDHCDGCAGGDSGCGMTAMDCAATMCASLMAMVPQITRLAASDRQSSSYAVMLAMVGRPSSPDPHPPRACDFC